MSTTVSYKGQTLATVSNQTKTLLTEGKYLEDDLTLVDVSGGGATLITKNISANGTYNASSDSADGYSQVNVSVPNTYAAGDEGKVVDSGALVAQTAHADVTPTTSDQTIDTTLNNSLKVKGDADLVASNIKKDVEIFGVTGSYEGGGGTVANGDQFVKRYTSVDRFDVYDTFSVDTIKPTAEKNALSTNAETVCFWNMTGASGQYTAQFALKGIKAKILVIPKVTRICVGMIQQIATLEKIDANMPRIDMDSINSCTALDTLILRGDSVPTLANISAFNNTCFASGKTGGTLYVPQSLMASYQSASNWSTILGYANNNIQKIEGSVYENAYADGTPIS